MLTHLTSVAVLVSALFVCSFAVPYIASGDFCLSFAYARFFSFHSLSRDRRG